MKYGVKGWTELKTAASKIEGKARGQINDSPGQVSRKQTGRSSISKPDYCQAEIVIIQDTREQQGWAEYFQNPYEIGTLRTGDYSAKGYESAISIERKSVDDLLGCLTSGRDRFERELERARELQFFCCIVEGTWPGLVLGQYRSKMNPNSAAQTICSWEVKFGMAFFFCGTPEMSAYKAESLLRKFVREQLKRLQEKMTF